MEEFNRIAKLSGERFRTEDPFKDPKWGDIRLIHHSSWPSLATINELGLVTTIMQDCTDPKTGQLDADTSSYVWGYMLPEKARNFVTKFNADSRNMSAALLEKDFVPTRIYGYQFEQGGTKTVYIHDHQHGRQATTRNGMWNTIIKCLEATG